MRKIPAYVLTGTALAALSACVQPGAGQGRDDMPFTPDYQGIETRLLDGDLVSFPGRNDRRARQQ